MKKRVLTALSFYICYLKNLQNYYNIYLIFYQLLIFLEINKIKIKLNNYITEKTNYNGLF